MNLETVLNDIEVIINNKDISIDEKRYVIDYIQKVCNGKLCSLSELENKNVLESYLSKYSGNISLDTEYTLEVSYDVDRELQDIFVEALYEMGVDGYGEYMSECEVGNSTLSDTYKSFYEDYRGYENDVFYVRPYNWTGVECYDCSCGLDDVIDEKGLDRYSLGFHSKDCVAWETNFYYKPSGLKIDWYKYPLRSAKSNHKLDKKTLKAILEHCVKSINK